MYSRTLAPNVHTNIFYHSIGHLSSLHHSTKDRLVYMSKSCICKYVTLWYGIVVLVLEQSHAKYSPIVTPVQALIVSAHD
jgi:hypothetical protein